MAHRLKPLDVSQVQTGSVRRRQYHIGQGHLAVMPEPTEPLNQFYHTLPKLGASARLLDAAELMAQAALSNRPMVWIIDGDFLATGLGGLVVQLIRRGLVGAIALNGRAALHDFELAFYGVAVEDRAEGLNDGLWGLSREPGEGINEIINEGVKRGFSIGECLGRGILERQPKHFKGSLLATGAARLVPTTVHLGIGAEGFDRYPMADGAMLGKGSLKDANLLSAFISQLPEGALVIAAHRDQALNQTLLYAWSMARNLNSDLNGMHLLSLGRDVPSLTDLPGLRASVELDFDLELALPLLMGALFSLVE